MFKGKKKLNPNTTDTVVGEGSVFEGRIKSEASLRIEGIVTGDIECIGDVTIGEHGTAKSNIIARNVTIAGTVNGNIATKGILTITSSGQLFGNASSHSLIIAEGGVFQGQSKMAVSESVHQSAASTAPVRDKDKETPYNPSYNSTTSSL